MKNLYLALGAVMILIGLWGFVQSPILGLFEVNALHNVIHIVTGALLVWAARSGDAAMAMWGKVLGVVYGLVAIVGFMMGDLFGLMMLNMYDNVLHLILAVVFLYAGFMKKPAAVSTTIPGGTM